MSDFFGHVALTSAITTGFVSAPLLMWCMLLWAIQYRWLKSRGKGGREAVEKQWLNWFEVIKFVSGAGGAAAITYFHYKKQCDHVSHKVLAYLLGVNIGEAVLSDIQKSWRRIPNAFAGLVLILTIPYEFANVDTLKEQMLLEEKLLFPTSFSWIALYTTWNAAFSYGGDWSWSTRLILIAPLIACFNFGTTDVWLSARCQSLMLNMIMRASETTRFYTPDGNCFITQKSIGGQRTFQHNDSVHTVWILINFISAIFLYFGTLT